MGQESENEIRSFILGHGFRPLVDTPARVFIGIAHFDFELGMDGGAVIDIDLTDWSGIDPALAVAIGDKPYNVSKRLQTLFRKKNDPACNLQVEAVRVDLACGELTAAQLETLWSEDVASMYLARSIGDETEEDDIAPFCSLLGAQSVSTTATSTTSRTREYLTGWMQLPRPWRVDLEANDFALKSAVVPQYTAGKVRGRLSMLAAAWPNDIRLPVERLAPSALRQFIERPGALPLLPG